MCQYVALRRYITVINLECKTTAAGPAGLEISLLCRIMILLSFLVGRMTRNIRARHIGELLPMKDAW